MEAALWGLLPTVLVGVAAPVAAQLVQRGVNRAYVVSGGFVLAACGYGMLTAAGTDSLWLVLAGAGVIAAGIVTVMSQMMDLALGTVPVEKAGTASSVLETGAEFGGALGMALLGSIGTAVYRHDIPGTAPAAAHETLGAALAVARQLPGRTGEALMTTAREAFTSGMQAAAIAGALLLLGAAVLAAVSLRQVHVRETACTEPEKVLA
jgi:DHA2 family multidrug resistance protein-like MFS transporter